MKFTTKDFDVRLESLENGQVAIYGSPESLEVVTDTIILCGTEEGTGLRPDGSGRLLCSAGTVALWLQFEVLNML